MPSVKASFRLVKTVVLLFGFLITRESFATTAADKSGGLGRLIELLFIIKEFNNLRTIS